jgi:hypothetical protein
MDELVRKGDGETIRRRRRPGRHREALVEQLAARLARSRAGGSVGALAVGWGPSCSVSTVSEGGGTILEFFYTDETFARVFFPTETLTMLDGELTASLKRSAQRRGEAGTCWPLRPVREPGKAGPEQEVLATRAHGVSFFLRGARRPLDRDRVRASRRCVHQRAVLDRASYATHWSTTTAPRPHRGRPCTSLARSPRAIGW